MDALVPQLRQVDLIEWSLEFLFDVQRVLGSSYSWTYWGKSAHKLIEIVGRLVQTDGNHLLGAHH